MAPSITTPYNNNTTDLPPPKDFTHLLSRSTRNRAPSSIKRFYKYFSIPGIGQLAGGLPNAHYFPFDTLEASVALPNRWQPTPLNPVDPPNTPHHDSTTTTSSPTANSPQKAAHIKVPHLSQETEQIHKIDLTSALQYGGAVGYLPLQNLIRTFTRDHLHPNVPYAGGPETIPTVGSTDGFSKVIQAFQNEWSASHDPIAEKQGLLVEEFTYMNAVQTAKPRGMTIVPVKIDEQGMLPTGAGSLTDVLENWDFTRGQRPHLLYTVAVGQNPTGAVTGLARKRALYSICQTYDVVIVEDEPYWFLQYPSSSSSFPSPPVPQKSSGYPFLDTLVPSYLSLDIDGRVVRLDTFSKTIAPGCRMGWITAQSSLMQRFQYIAETSTQQPSGFVQALVAEVLLGSKGRMEAKGEGWQMDGWVRWLEGLRGAYERRMRAMCRVLDEGRLLVSTSTSPTNSSWDLITTTPLLSYTRPLGGMFLWLTIPFPSHPLFSSPFSGSDLSTALWVYWTHKPYLVLLSPGTIFAATEEVERRDGWKWFRLCFAACEEGEVEGLTQRVVDGVRAFWALDEGEVSELLRESREESVEDEGVVSLMGAC